MSEIRHLKEEEIPVILSWYNWYIEHGTQSFETSPLTIAQFSDRVHGIIQNYPYIVIEDHGELCGYAYLDHFSSRAAYDWTADLSIYLDPQKKGKGYGSALLKAILSLAEKDGYHSIVSVITETNTDSIRFHESFGFIKMGTLPKVGYKFNQWLGVVYYMKTISEAKGTPASLKNFDVSEL
jgi:phosphinothricin acetyltransferase